MFTPVCSKYGIVIEINCRIYSIGVNRGNTSVVEDLIWYNKISASYLSVIDRRFLVGAAIIYRGTAVCGGTLTAVVFGGHLFRHFSLKMNQRRTPFRAVVISYPFYENDTYTEMNKRRRRRRRTSIAVAT